MNRRELNDSQIEQLELFKELLKGKQFSRGDVRFRAVVGWLKLFPKSLKMTERDQIRAIVCDTFSMTQEELDEELVGKKPNGDGRELMDTTSIAKRYEMELNELLPQYGLLRRYMQYTEHSEAPLSYHVFSFLCVVGAIMNRRVHFDMGYYKVYPTLGIIILGPSGIKKTSATNIAVDILQLNGVCKVYSEKLTPEALVEAMRGDNATGLIYAPEMAVFLNKAQYNEGLVQLITRFMDCPDVWESGTIGRGKSALRNVAISSLMCSTPDWFVSSIPPDSFGGGFIARNLLVVQDWSARCEPIPRPGDPNDRKWLSEQLAYIHEVEGEATFSKPAATLYDEWYRGEHQEEILSPEHELLATYHNRKPDHLKRIAMALHVSQEGDLEVSLRSFETAIKLLKWNEQFLPSLLKQMFKSQAGEARDLVLRQIRNLAPIPHSVLVHQLSHRMDAATIKGVILSLKEEHIVQEFIDNVGHYYTLYEEEK